MMKVPRVPPHPSLHVDKHVRDWYRHWLVHHTPPPFTAMSQDHLGITGVVSDFTTRLQNAESLLPVAVAHHKADRETRG